MHVVPGGPAGVSSQLKHDQARIRAGYRHDYSDSWLQPYYQTKSRHKRNNGLSFSADYNALGQWASSSLSEDDAAFGGVLRFYGRWEATGSGGAQPGALVWKIENRSAYGDSINPHELGAEIGLIAKTTDFNDYGWGVTNLQWQQYFRDGKSLIAAGQVDVHEWHDVFAFNSPWTDIKITALVYPASPIPSQGLGAMGFSMFGDRPGPGKPTTVSSCRPTLPSGQTCRWFSGQLITRARRSYRCSVSPLVLSFSSVPPVRFGLLA